MSMPKAAPNPNTPFWRRICFGALRIAAGLLKPGREFCRKETGKLPFTRPSRAEGFEFTRTVALHKIAARHVPNIDIPKSHPLSHVDEYLASDKAPAASDIHLV